MISLFMFNLPQSIGSQVYQFQYNHDAFRLREGFTLPERTPDDSSVLSECGNFIESFRWEISYIHINIHCST